MGDEVTESDVDSFVRDDRLTVTVKHTFNTGKYQSISPHVSLSRNIKPGESMSGATKAMLKEILPLFGVATLKSLAIQMNVIPEDMESIRVEAMRLLQGE